MRQRTLRTAALLAALAACGCGDGLSVRGTLTRGGRPFGPADGETVVLTLTGPLFKHDFAVGRDGSFWLAAGSDPLKPGDYTAVVTVIRVPEEGRPAAPAADRPPTREERRRGTGPPPPPRLTTYAVPGPVAVEPGRAGGYVIEVPEKPGGGPKRP